MERHPPYHIFKGSVESEEFIKDAKETAQIENDTFVKILDRTLATAYKDIRITEFEFKKWNEELHTDPDKTKVAMKALLFITKWSVKLKLSDDELKEDLVRLNFSDEKITLIIKGINKYRNEIEKEAFKGEGFRIHPFQAMTWRVDLKLRDEFRNGIIKPTAIIRISYGSETGRY